MCVSALALALALAPLSLSPLPPSLPPSLPSHPTHLERLGPQDGVDAFPPGHLPHVGVDVCGPHPLPLELLLGEAAVSVAAPAAAVCRRRRVHPAGGRRRETGVRLGVGTAIRGRYRIKAVLGMDFITTYERLDNIWVDNGCNAIITNLSRRFPQTIMVCANITSC